MNRRNATIFTGVGCGIIVLLAAAVVFAGIFFLRSVDFSPFEGGIPETGGEPQAEEPAPEITRPVNLEEPLLVNQELPELENLNEVFNFANPGVVNIQVITNQGGGAGSGFILNEEGYIATNHHVIAGADTVFVQFFNEVQARAVVVGSDPDSDLVVLLVEELVPEAHPLPIGDSSGVAVGDQVVAIGSPFGLANTMTYGIVSAVGRVIPSGFEPFNIPEAIQTDAPINPGNSGGPLLNLNGEVIGVNAQIQTGGSLGNVGVGFAIPSHILEIVVPVLIEEGEFEWPWLGVSGMPVTLLVAEANQLETQDGAYIAEVVAGSPADDAGLQGSTGVEDMDGFSIPVGGDVVVEANGEQINDFNELVTIVAFSQPGETITLAVLRNGERIEIPVELVARPPGEELVPEDGRPFPFPNP